MIEFIRNTSNQNTRKTYEQGMNIYKQWCIEHNPVLSFKEEEITDNDVAEFAQYSVVNKGLAYSTVVNRIAAINDHVRYVKNRENNSLMQSVIVSRMLKVLERITPSVRSMGLCSINHLRTILLYMKSNEHIKLMAINKPRKRTMDRDLLMFVFARVFMLRASEITLVKHGHIKMNLESAIEDVANTPLTMIVTLYQSKNLKPGETHERQTVLADVEFEELCAIRLYMNYIINHYSTKSKEELSSEYVFLQIGNGKILSRSTPNHRLQYWIKEAKIQNNANDKICFHGLRAGAATDAAHANIPIHLIMRYGHWKSNAGLLYIRESVHDKNIVSSHIINKQ